MRLTIVPLSEVPSSLLKDYLGGQGMPSEIISWKYFDSAFNRGRERGFVWLREGRVAGFVGLIPFDLSGGGNRSQTAWTCDWSVGEPDANPGFGVMLLKRAIDSCGHLMALGGNENTQRLLPRIATRTVPEAGLMFGLPLRLGAVFRKLGRLPEAGPLRRIFSALSGIPLRWVGGAESRVRVERGVSPAISALLESERGPGWSPRYDFEYLNWQVGRCPAVVSWTCIAPGEAGSRAAALFWRPVDSSNLWRTAVWMEAGGQESLRAVLREVVRRIYGEGGVAVSAIVSRLDHDLIQILREIGFVRIGAPRPLFVCTPGRNRGSLDEPGRLSYLDTDLAYRF